MRFAASTLEAIGEDDIVSDTEYHVAAAGSVAVGIGAQSADDQVVHAIAVDIAGGADREAGKITRRLAVEHKAVAAIKAGQWQRRAEPGGFAEHHVAASGITAVCIGNKSADDQVVDAIAVDVAGGADRGARIIIRRLAVEHEAVRAV